MTRKDEKASQEMCIADVEMHLSYAKSCIQELQCAVRRLPKVDKDGSSECPFAEDIYANKEDAQKQAVHCQSQLDKSLQWIEGQIHSCSNDLAVITAHESQLHKDRPRSHFSDAEAKLAAYYNRLVKLKETVKDAFKEVQEAIIQASQKQYPGKIPQPSGFPKLDDRPASFGDGISCPDFDHQIRDIVSRGPID